MVNNLEDEVLESFNIGEEVILESVDTNSALDSRIVEKMKVGDRVNSDLRYHRRNVPKSKSSYRRNDLPKTYLLADALLKEVRENARYGEVIPIVSETFEAEYWDLYTNSEINGKNLSENDKKILENFVEKDFLPLRYHDSVYFVSKKLLDNDNLSDNFIKTHGLDEVISKLGLHLYLEILTPKETLPDSKAEVIFVYGRTAEKQNVFPGHEREHTSLLMENTYESTENGYDSRVPDELVKGGDEYFDHLPLPDEIGLKVERDDEKVLRMEEKKLDGLIEKNSKQQRS